ncbi:hypothetical protein HanIR_Chr02g0082891 [Helianthus annuus]|nr:hypothetical protein HanIR_Chr02g0082891 [Helianthus annuus]
MMYVHIVKTSWLVPYSKPSQTNKLPKLNHINLESADFHTKHKPSFNNLYASTVKTIIHNLVYNVGHRKSFFNFFLQNELFVTILNDTH